MDHTPSRRQRSVVAWTMIGAMTVAVHARQLTHGLPTDSTFFPIAVWLQSPSRANEYRAIGVNLFVGLWEGPTKAQLDALQSVNMRTFCDQNQFALSNLTSYQDVIAGWTHQDEPDNAQANGSGGYDPCIDTAIIQSKYRDMVAADSTRPVYLNLGQGVSYTGWYGRGDCTGNTRLYPGYIRGCDIVSYDIYPVNSTDAAVSGKLWYVPKGVDSLRMWGGDARPVWCWIECTEYDQANAAKPTSAQVKSEVWMALIHGARGVGYFCHVFTPSFIEAGPLADTQMKNALDSINHQVLSLAPALNSPTVTGKATVTSSNAAVPVDVMVKICGTTTYLFAVAMRNDTAHARFSLSGVNGTSVEVIGENRTVPISGSAFADAFTGYQVHLYRIAGSASAAEFDGHSPLVKGCGRYAIVPTANGNRLVVVNGTTHTSWDVRGVRCNAGILAVRAPSGK